MQDNKNGNIIYKDLAWIDTIITSPQETGEEAETLCNIIKKHTKQEVKSLLHLGCGAGFHDYTFKKHFKLTGVDLSLDMLKIAREINPEVEYHCDDMRSVKLGKLFDAVAIPDSIDHMETIQDLKSAIQTAYQHLKPGGICLILGHIQEEFKANNFVYSGTKDNIEITLFENNYIPEPFNNTYESTVACLVRKSGKLEIFTDTFQLGLFDLKNWLKILEETGFNVKQDRLDHLYDDYLLDGGEYKTRVFICKKPE